MARDDDLKTPEPGQKSTQKKVPEKPALSESKPGHPAEADITVNVASKQKIQVKPLSESRTVVTGKLGGLKTIKPMRMTYTIANYNDIANSNDNGTSASSPGVRQVTNTVRTVERGAEENLGDTPSQIEVAGFGSLGSTSVSRTETITTIEKGPNGQHVAKKVVRRIGGPSQTGVEQSGPGSLEARKKDFVARQKDFEVQVKMMQAEHVNLMKEESEQRHVKDQKALMESLMNGPLSKDGVFSLKTEGKTVRHVPTDAPPDTTVVKLMNRYDL